MGDWLIMVDQLDCFKGEDECEGKESCKLFECLIR